MRSKDGGLSPDSSYRWMLRVLGRLLQCHRTGSPFTLKVVADSGLARTRGEIRTMPEKWPGLSAAVRMVMAPPCNRNGQSCHMQVSTSTYISDEHHQLILNCSPGQARGRPPWNRQHRMLAKLNLQLFYYTCFFFLWVFQEQTFQRDINKVSACGLQVKQ